MKLSAEKKRWISSIMAHSLVVEAKVLGQRLLPASWLTRAAGNGAAL
jgi:hypothetical protein